VIFITTGNGFAFALLGLVMSASVVMAQTEQPAGALGDPSGPGQAVGMPTPECPRTIACQYAERNMLPNGYRFQSLQVCGANCTVQYWVSGIEDGQLLLEIDPVRGGGVLAVARSASADGRPAVRTVLPSYAERDAACCPSGFADTTYTWDPSSDALVAGDAAVTPAGEFPGWDAVRAELLQEGWILAGV
jgi:hypothetical protein